MQHLIIKKKIQFRHKKEKPKECCIVNLKSLQLFSFFKSLGIISFDSLKENFITIYILFINRHCKTHFFIKYFYYKRFMFNKNDYDFNLHFLGNENVFLTILAS